MANFTAFNSTKLQDEFEIVIIIWYAAIGICGTIGNTFVIAVISSRSHLNSSHLMIIWLGCTDLINCLALPLRYKMFHQATMVSPRVCDMIRFIVIFLYFLNITSLGMVAIERYKAVQNINKNVHLSGKTVGAMVGLCILASAIFTIPIICFFMNDSISCNKLDGLNIYAYSNFAGFMIPGILMIVSTFILIAVLYVKICILVRTRVGGCKPNSVQQLPNKNSSSEPVRPTEGKVEKRTKEVLHFHQVKDDEEYHRRESDVVICEFIDVQLREETPSQFSNKPRSSQRSIYMISGVSPSSGSSQSEQESVSSCEYHLPGPSSSSVHQIPGLVMDEHDNESQIPPPTMHNTIVQLDSGDSKTDGPIIPVLNNQYPHSYRVTCMLFIVTLVFFVTYVTSPVMMLFPYGLARQFSREFVLINHIINPVIYSIVNEGFRESCISFVQRIRERMGF